jgi:hypothetical protein
MRKKTAMQKQSTISYGAGGKPLLAFWLNASSQI